MIQTKDSNPAPKSVDAILKCLTMLYSYPEMLRLVAAAIKRSKDRVRDTYISNAYMICHLVTYVVAFYISLMISEPIMTEIKDVTRTFLTGRVLLT